MGAFDDLIPASGRRRREEDAPPPISGRVGAFDDLIPAAPAESPGVLRRLAEFVQSTPLGELAPDAPARPVPVEGEDLSLGQTIGNAFRRGFARLGSTVRSAPDDLRLAVGEGSLPIPGANVLATLLPDAAESVRAEAIAGLAPETARTAQRLAALPGREATSRVAQAETLGQAFGEFSQDPVGVLTDVGVESGIQLLPAIIAAFATRSPAVAGAALGGSSATTELVAGVTEFLADQGTDVTDPDAIAAALSNSDTARAALRFGATRGAIIGSLDAASGGLAGRTIAPALTRSPVAREAISTFVGQPALQGALGAGGEIGAQLATTGEIRPGEAFLEAIGEVASAPAEVGAFALDRLTGGDRPVAPDNLNDPIRRAAADQGIDLDAVVEAIQSQQTERPTADTTADLDAEVLRRLDAVPPNAPDLAARLPAIAGATRAELLARIREAPTDGLRAEAAADLAAFDAQARGDLTPPPAEAATPNAPPPAESASNPPLSDQTAPAVAPSPAQVAPGIEQTAPVPAQTQPIATAPQSAAQPAPRETAQPEPTAARDRRSVDEAARDPLRPVTEIDRAPNGQIRRDSRGRPLRRLAFRPEVDDLVVFLASEGGISPEVAREAGVDVAAFKGRKNLLAVGVPNGRVLNPNGLNPDRLVERLQKAGFLPPNPPNAPPTVGINDALDLVARATNGGERILTAEGQDAEGTRRAQEFLENEQAAEQEFARLADELMQSKEALEFDLARAQQRDFGLPDVPPGDLPAALTLGELSSRATDMGATAEQILDATFDSRSQLEAARNLARLIQQLEARRGPESQTAARDSVGSPRDQEAQDGAGRAVGDADRSAGPADTGGQVAGSESALPERPVTDGAPAQDETSDRDLFVPTRDEAGEQAQAQSLAPYPVRPTATVAAVERGLDALNALVRRFSGSVLARAFDGDLRAGRGSQILGKTVTSLQDLAVVNQVNRDPRFETLRYIIVNDGIVVGETAVSSRAAASSGAFTSSATANDPTIAWLKTMQQRFPGGRLMLVHNHPSASPAPSSADEQLTASLPAILRRNGITLPLDGHVVIDFDQFGQITLTSAAGRGGRPGVRTKVLRLPNAPPNDPLVQPSGPLQQWVSTDLRKPGSKAASPESVAQAAQLIQGEAGQPSGFTAILASSNFDIRAIVTLDLTRPITRRDMASLNRAMRLSGTPEVFLTTGASLDAIPPTVRENINALDRAGLIRDVIGVTSGRVVSLLEQGQLRGDPGGRRRNTDTRLAVQESLPESSPSLVPEATPAERNAAEQARRDAKRNGLGRDEVPPSQGDGDLFAGPRPEQGRLFEGANTQNLFVSESENFSADDDINPDRIIEIHGIKNRSLFDSLRRDMQARGFIGRPILAWRDASGSVFALTGSHRLAAARQARLDTVPVLFVDPDAFERAVELSFSGSFDGLIGSGDDRVADALRAAGDTVAADLMEAEIQANFDAGSSTAQASEGALRVEEPTGDGAAPGAPRTARPTQEELVEQARRVARRASSALRIVAQKLRAERLGIAEIRQLAAEANRLIGEVSVAPDLDQQLREARTEVAKARRRARSGAAGALRSLEAQAVEVRNAEDRLLALQSKMEEAVRAVEKLQRLEGKATLRERQAAASALETALREAGEARASARKLADSRIAHARARQLAVQRRTDTLGRLEAAGFQRGAVGWNYSRQQWDGYKGRLTESRRVIQDRFLRLKQGQADIEAVLGDALPDIMDAYRLENLTHGRIAEKTLQNERQFIGPIQQIMRERKLSLDKLHDIMLAMAAPDRNRNVAAINPALPDGGSGIATSTAEGILAGTEAGPYSGERLTPAEVRAGRMVMAQLQEMRRRTLDNMVRSGTITRKLVDQLLKREPNYVPLRGPDELGRFGTGAGRADRPGPRVRRALGRGEGNLPENMLAEMISDAEQSIVAAELAPVREAILRQALLFPNEEAYTVEPVDMEWRFSELTGEAFLAPKRDQKARDDSFIIPFEGRTVRLRFNDPLLREAMLNLGEQDLGAVIRFFGAFNRWQSAVFTRYNPGFVLINLLKDAGFGITRVASRHGAKIAGQVAGGYGAAAAAIWRASALNERADLSAKPFAEWGAAEFATEFIQVGGQTGIIRPNDLETIRSNTVNGLRALNDLWSDGVLGKAQATRQVVRRAVEPLGKVIEDVNNSIENALRLSLFTALRKSGMTAEQAAEQAKNVTVNFNRKGAWGSHLNAIFLFFNASVQGSVAVLDAFRDKRVLVALGALGVLQALSTLALMADDDDDGVSRWDGISRFRRNTSLTLVAPWAEDGVVTIPLAYGFNLIPQAFGRVTELMRDLARGDEDAWSRFAVDEFAAVTQSFSPIPLEDGASAILGNVPNIILRLRANENEFGRPLSAETFGRPIPKSTLGRPETPKVFTAVATALNRLGGGTDEEPPLIPTLDVSPETLAFLWRQVAGGLGSSIDRGIRVTEGMLNGRFEDFSEALAAAPVTSAFTIRSNQDRGVGDRYFRERDRTEINLRRLRLRTADLFDRLGDTPEFEEAFEALVAQSGSHVQGAQLRRSKTAGKRPDGTRRFRGDLLLSESGGRQIPRIEAEEGSTWDAFRQAEKVVKAEREAIRDARLNEALSGREREAIIKAAVKRRREAQQTFLRALNAENRR